MLGLKNLPDTTIGVIAMTVGLVLLLYMLGVNSLKIIIILGACALVVYGFILSGLYKKMMNFINKIQKTK